MRIMKRPAPIRIKCCMRNSNLFVERTIIAATVKIDSHVSSRFRTLLTSVKWLIFYHNSAVLWEWEISLTQRTLR